MHEYLLGGTLVGVIDQEVKIQNDSIQLSGTLSQPSALSKGVVVLCLHGSGPLNRDSNTSGLKLDIFNIFADRFKDNNISCLRYDKRGCGSSGGEYYTAGHSDFVSDAACWIQYLKEVGYEKIYLMGHSEGTLIAAQLASQVDGIILLCPFITPLNELLVAQAAEYEKEIAKAGFVSKFFYAVFKRIFGGLSEGQKKLIDKVKSGEEASFKHLFKTIPAKWMRELFLLDYKDIYSKLSTPSLVIGAEKDMQCPPDDIFKIAECANTKVETVLVPELTHLLRKWNSEASFSSYAKQLKKEMDPQLVSLVVDWVEDNK